MPRNPERTEREQGCEPIYNTRRPDFAPFGARPEICRRMPCPKDRLHSNVFEGLEGNWHARRNRSEDGHCILLRNQTQQRVAKREVSLILAGGAQGLSRGERRAVRVGVNSN